MTVASKIRRLARELDVRVRRSRSGLQLVDRYGHVFLGKQKGATVEEIVERLDVISRYRQATPDKPVKIGRSTFYGWVRPDDPRYQSGWNFLMGKNLAQC